MTTIKIYENDNEIEIEVEDSFATAYAEMEHRDALIERKETRRHQSLNASMDNGFDFKDESVDIEGDVLRSEQKDDLHKAIAKLLPEQQELVRRVYFENVSQEEIAKQLGITKQSVSDRMSRIYKQLRKYL